MYIRGTTYYTMNDQRCRVDVLPSGEVTSSGGSEAVDVGAAVAEAVEAQEHHKQYYGDTEHTESPSCFLRGANRLRE